MIIEFPEEESREFEIGQRVPTDLRPLCKKNEYGQFSLRFEKFLYLVNDDFRIEDKARDILSCYPLDDYTPGKNPESTPEIDSIEPMDLPEFEDLEPEPEQDVVDKIVKAFTERMANHNIVAKEFQNEFISEQKRDALRLVLHGDASSLDTRSGDVEEEKVISLKEHDLSLLKAALLHKLYMRTPQLLRHENMGSFISDIILLEEDGSKSMLVDNLSPGKQSDLLFFFNQLSNIYKELSDVIEYIHHSISANILDEYQKAKNYQANLLFKGYFIHKVYQLLPVDIQKLDVMTIHVLKEIIDFK